jgi:hypothetical protein
MDGSQKSIVLDSPIAQVLGLAISADGTFIAVGCGAEVLLYRVLNDNLELATRLEVAAKITTTNVRNQRLSFSVDSKKLVAALQVSQTPQRHAVYMKVWECSGADVREETSLDPIQLTVVSGGFFLFSSPQA